MSKYKGKIKLGRLSSGLELGRGAIVHAFPVEAPSTWVSVCGSRPGGRSAGWSTSALSATSINCTRCLERMKKEFSCKCQQCKARGFVGRCPWSAKIGG